MHPVEKLLDDTIAMERDLNKIFKLMSKLKKRVRRAKRRIRRFTRTSTSTSTSISMNRHDVDGGSPTAPIHSEHDQLSPSCPTPQVAQPADPTSGVDPHAQEDDASNRTILEYHFWA